MYFTLVNDILIDSNITFNAPDDLPVELDFMGGESVTLDISLPMVFSTNAKSGDKLPDFKKGSFTIMSQRFIDLLQCAGVDNLQLFPVIIKSDVDGTSWDGYFGVNILGIVECADLSHSTYDEIMPEHYAFDELAIHAEKAQGKLLFRLKEHLPTIIIHRSVGRYIKDNDPEKNMLGWTVKKIIQ